MAGVERWWDDLTRERFAAILDLVLNAIADDYDNLEIILKTINEWYRPEPDLAGSKALEAIPVTRQEVIRALRELTREGFAQAHSYDAQTQRFLPASFRHDVASVLWYYVTDNGKNAVNRIHKRGPEIC